MSDILASIRKIMAQEPASPPPGPTRATLNSVSGTALDLSREPELKLPPRKSEAEGASTPAAPTGEPVSLDELLAETPRVTTPSGLAPKPPAAPKLASEPEAAQSTGAPEWLFPRPSPSETANDTPATSPVQALPQAKDTHAPPAAKATTEAASSDPAVKSAPAEQPKPTKEASPPAATIGPPAPKLGDLGSVVPARFDGAGSAPTLEAGPGHSESGDRPVLGPPLAGPLLGEPARTPTVAEPIPDVPGADALRRLIAGVIPPSAHPSVAPSAKAPEAGPTPATTRTGDAPKDADRADAGPKPAPEAKTETPVAAQPSITKKIDVPASAPAPSLAPESKSTAAATVITPAPPPKPAAPAVAARTEPAKPTAVVTTAAPSSEAPTKPAPAGKSMDETVVELLRPLLKDWLDTNMPRLIEPALKAELEALRNAAAKDKKD